MDILKHININILKKNGLSALVFRIIADSNYTLKFKGKFKFKLAASHFKPEFIDLKTIIWQIIFDILYQNNRSDNKDNKVVEKGTSQRGTLSHPLNQIMTTLYLNLQIRIGN